MSSQKFRVLSHRDAFRFAFDSLTRQGVSGPDAKTTAEGLVDADLCGVDTHGIQRIPIYCQRLKLIDKRCSPGSVSTTLPQFVFTSTVMMDWVSLSLRRP